VAPEQTLISRANLEATEYQKRVDDYFESAADYWKDIYGENQRLLATIYRERRELVLRWVDDLRLHAGSRILEIGCGAGVTTAALARKYHVWAVDTAQAMVESTRHEAVVRGVAANVVAHIGDVHSLPYRPDTFDAVIAMGVIPWLHSESNAVAETARVLKPGGFLIATADNRCCLTWMLDPERSPLAAPARWACKFALRVLHRNRAVQFYCKRHSRREVETLLSSADLQMLQSATIGYGPFSIFGRYVLPDSTGIKLHRAVTRLAQTQFIPGLSAAGCHILALAQKPKSTYR
jgi:SAM-dependent methyltransferase